MRSETCRILCYFIHFPYIIMKMVILINLKFKKNDINNFPTKYISVFCIILDFPNNYCSIEHKQLFHLFHNCVFIFFTIIFFYVFSAKYMLIQNKFNIILHFIIFFYIFQLKKIMLHWVRCPFVEKGDMFYTYER